MPFAASSDVVALCRAASVAWVQARLTDADPALVLTDDERATGHALSELLDNTPGPVLAVAELPPYAALRLLIQRDYPQLAGGFAAEDDRFMLAYGTLRDDVPTYAGFRLPNATTLARDLRIPGRMYDCGEWPAVAVDHAAVLGDCATTESVVADVLRLDGVTTDGREDAASLLAAYDAYEELDPTDWSATYRRVFIPTGLPGFGGAWIYDRVGACDDLPHVIGGRWSDRRSR